jgi:hypothetical protein
VAVRAGVESGRFVQVDYRQEQAKEDLTSARNRVRADLTLHTAEA